MKVIMIFSLLLNSACSVVGISTTEEPEYKVIKSDGDKEVREYEPYIIAQTEVSGDMEEAGNTGFKRLAAYIFAKNRDGDKIEMTAPVTQKNKREKIEMTAPVMQKKNPNEGSYFVSFIMPKKYTLDTLPPTKDDRIEFIKVPKRFVAAIEYTWYRTEKKNKEKAAVLKAWVNSLDDFQIDSEYFSAGYNPPWTIPFLRRNEVMFELAK